MYKMAYVKCAVSVFKTVDSTSFERFRTRIPETDCLILDVLKKY